MKFVMDNPPTRKEYLLNMEAKMQDDEFLGDIAQLLRPEENYNPQLAYKEVRDNIIEKI